MKCHRCTCFQDAPCDPCVDCRHADHPDCPEDCDTCEIHEASEDADLAPEPWDNDREAARLGGKMIDGQFVSRLELRFAELTPRERLLFLALETVASELYPGPDAADYGIRDRAIVEWLNEAREQDGSPASEEAFAVLEAFEPIEVHIWDGTEETSDRIAEAIPNDWEYDSIRNGYLSVWKHSHRSDEVHTARLTGPWRVEVCGDAFWLVPPQ